MDVSTIVPELSASEMMFGNVVIESDGFINWMDSYRSRKPPLPVAQERRSICHCAGSH